jgi:hypothetical protein
MTMKYLLSLVAALTIVPAAHAQTAPAAPAAPAATAAPAQPLPAAKFNLDTPIEVLAADEKAKAVLMTDLPELLPHPSYEMFKGMSLRGVQPYSNGQLTDEILAKVEAHLAAIK